MMDVKVLVSKVGIISRGTGLQVCEEQRLMVSQDLGDLQAVRITNKTLHPRSII
jgi:hypothetical protein